jgi:hypothetical protein
LEKAVSTAPDRDAGAIAFAERLLAVLDEGRKTATYKFAVLIALMDLCLEGSSVTGLPPRSIPTCSLAEKVIELYWPHLRTFPGSAPSILMQKSGGQAAILQAIGRFAESLGTGPSVSLFRARREARDSYKDLVRSVEWTLAKMPLPKLQRVGRIETRFLYRIAWDDDVKRAEFFADRFDRAIYFEGGAADHMLRLSALLRPVIQREWTRLVARLNREVVPEAQLEEFLFGLERESTAPVRSDLAEIQSGRCFYCEGPLRSKFDVDHFVPWSRHPDRGLDNLVAADRWCNAAKSDHLAAADHVAHWLTRIDRHKADLDEIARKRHWERQPHRTIASARSIYFRLPLDAVLWAGKGTFVELNRPQLERAFST